MAASETSQARKRSAASRRTASRLGCLGALVALLAMAGPAGQAKAEAAAPRRAPVAAPASGDLAYGALVAAVRERRVRLATIDEQAATVTVSLRDGHTATGGWPDGDFQLLEQLEASGAVVRIVPGSGSSGGATGSASGLLWPLLLLATLGCALYYWRRRSESAGNKIADAVQLREGIVVELRPAIRFADVAGCEEAVEELREILEYTRRPLRFRRVGARLPTGILLFGPPGTGKTMLARALAGESGRAFYSVSGSEFVQVFVGVGAKRVRELFERARKEPDGAIVFIDELDALGRARQGNRGLGGGDEREQTLNQLLVELDGFSPAGEVICLAATNRRDVLDPALLRPGRFGRQLEIGFPSARGRAAILAVHTRGKPLAADVDLDPLARISAGFSGAQLAELVNEAALLAARADRLEIGAADFREAHFRILAGPAKHDPSLADGEDDVIAVHEAGHVLCAEVCPHHENAQSATVRARGGAGGMALIAQHDRALVDPALVHERMVVALGGRAAEQTVFGRVSSGASNDLAVVNAIARQAIERLGFSAAIGQLVPSSDPEAQRLSEHTLAAIDREVEHAVGAAYKDALELLEAQRPQLEHLAERLRTQRDLERVDIVLALEGAQPTRLVPALRPDDAVGASDSVPCPAPAVVRPFTTRRRRSLLEGLRERAAAFARAELARE